MPFFDFSLDELKRYLPAREEPADFDIFWQDTLTDVRQHPLEARFAPLDTGLKTIDVFDVTFNGYGGQPIKGWLLLPHQRAGRLPCVVEYIGYGGGRGFALDWLLFASAGYAHLVMDTRGQGSGWLIGDTPDPHGSGPSTGAFMTRGIESPYDYFYRRVYTDAVRCVEVAAGHPEIDADRIAVAGISQGGGIAIAAAALADPVAAVLPDVPFLCDFPRAVGICDETPYLEIRRYLASHRDAVDETFRTLGYFDGVAFARRAHAPVQFSVALMDTICPPSTVYGAYNAYAGDKAIQVYPFNGHEGGQVHQEMAQIAWLRTQFSCVK